MFSYLFRAFKMIYNIKKSWVYYTLFLRITVGILPLLELWIFQSIIDQVTIFITTNNDELSTLIGLICLQFGVLILRNIINEHINFIDIEMEQLLNHHMGKLLINKLQSVPYFFFEIPSFYNHLHRIRNNYATRFLRPIKSGLETVQNLITIASYLGFLFSVHWLLVIMGFAVAIPTFVIQYKFGGFKFNIYKSYSGKLRESNYINSLMGEKQSIKEIKLNSLENYLLKKWEKIILSYNKDYLDVTNKQRKANIKLGMLSSFLYVLGSILTIYIINNQRITIGQFVTVIQALKQLQDSVNHTAFLIASLLESGMYIKDFIEFIDYEEENQEKKYEDNTTDNRISNKITVDNLSYKYPMSENYSLKNVSLAIKENQTIAIVGGNGSGKSTFIKVLIGLYPASEGRVYFGDREIKDINQESLWNNITVIFQDFVKFAYSLRENIAFSNINKIENQQRIRDVSKVTGVDKLVENLPEGYNTKLGKIHIDSIDISGGEWQKIALSRALFKDSNMIILDEPTASIDPKTELSIFNEFANLVRNKTAILITHRMASARIADRIFVMSNGEVVEDGTHDELIKKQGLYCTMYESQASWYK